MDSRVASVRKRRGLKNVNLALVALLAVFMLVLAACGGDDEADDADAGDDAADDAGDDAGDDAADDAGDDAADDAGDDAAAEFPNVVDGVLQPLASGFPSEAITLWQPFEPGSGDDVFNQFIAQVGAKYAPVDVRTDTQQMGPALTYELSEFLKDRPGSEDGYNIFAVSWFGQTTRAFTQEALADIPFEELLARLNPINRMTFAPYSFLAALDGDFATIQDAEEFALANPGELTISSSSPGGGIHSSTLVWASQAGIDFTYIPTDSPAAARQVLQGGGSDMATSRTEPGLDEEFNFLMITGDGRLDDFPDVPAAAEFGYNIPSGTSRGYGTIPDVPQEHIDWLVEWLRLVSEDPEFREQYSALNLTYQEPDEVEADRQAVIQEFGPILEAEGVVVRDDF